MNQSWKALVVLFLGGSLMACSAAEQKPVEKPTEKTEQPEVVLKAQKTSDGKLILGEREWVYVKGLDDNFNTRIDTGATTSSISAVDVIPFERDGKDWVKFKIEHDGIKSKELALPVARWVDIRQSSSEGTQRRAVVEAWIQIGDLESKTEFTLTDRTHLTFPLLLGRSFFKDIAVVDVARKYVQDKHK
ncbi:ATP-dependent zinc protease family protein [Vibrio hepatarius]|uniref:ATP-dependent zinc protease family protein n=1 Tax=Vibrio hepatarius TaxID=171383 RepID=UPI00142DD157|nr:ATP-dependent zinc protease [Vibrio hepatarius]NIY81969.1 ATP-dependent zinc protease [Vibrio hepatarius]NVJ56098.1 ATP-dependent zinc protease [Vibrionaceae bacterium]